MLGLLLWIAFVQAQQDNYFQAKSFLIHLEEEHNFLKHELKNAVDVQLIHHGNMDKNHFEQLCQIQQRGVEVETQEMHVIQENDITSDNFDPDLPVQVKQFVSMSHINDGVLVVDSQAEIYMLKFNYQQLHNKSNLTNDEDRAYRQPRFANLKWRANLGQLHVTETKELPQLVYNSLHNMAFIVYSDSAMFFSVTEMENNQNQLKVSISSDFKGRKQRGWTKSFENHLYSAVGSHGIDVYTVKENDLIYYDTITAEKIYGENHLGQQLYVEDFEIVKLSDSKRNHFLYILDQTRGIIILQILYSDTSQQPYYLLRMDGIGPLQGGIAMDTFDGVHVVAAYEQQSHYATYELRVDLSKQTWEVIEIYKQHKRIQDVKINQDIAIIQGLNHFQVIFFGTRPDVRKFEVQEPTYIQHGGMRDFEFFDELLSNPKYQQYSQNHKGSLQPHYQLDDFVLGISKHKLFVTKYRVETPLVRCYTDNDEKIGSQYLYSVVYNTSNCLEKDTEFNKVCKQRIRFSVQVVHTLLFTDKIIVVIVFSVVSGLVIFALIFLLMVSYRTYCHNQSVYERQIKELSNRTTAMNVSAELNSIQNLKGSAC